MSAPIRTSRHIRTRKHLKGMSSAPSLSRVGRISPARELASQVQAEQLRLMALSDLEYLTAVAGAIEQRRRTER